MNLYTAFALFMLIILVYFVIAEVFTIQFRMTGMDEEKARFQVVSLLTGSGFTTNESELVTSSKYRRKLARIIMMFGYVFNITFVSAFVNIFITLKQNEVTDLFFDIAVPIGIILVLVILLRIPKARDLMNNMIKSIFERFHRNKEYNPLTIIDNIEGKSIVSVKLNKIPEQLVNKTLLDSGLKNEHNIIVLLIESKNREINDVHADTIMKNGDIVTMYGDYHKICKVFNAKELYVDE